MDRLNCFSARAFLHAVFLRTVGIAAFAAACLAPAAALNPTDLSGGSFTVLDTTGQAYSRPGPVLHSEQLRIFAQGEAEFRQRWVPLFNIGGNWGRGPTSNGETCTDCHAGNGRGRAPDSADERLGSMLVRLSIPGEDIHGGPLPHPAYGLQMQEHGVLGKVPPEGRIVIGWREHEVRFADGELARLREPTLRFEDLGYGPLGDIRYSPRVAPPVFGLGLLEAVSTETLIEVARAQAQIGFAGRLNRVWDVDAQAHVPGRFGWKAIQPTLKQQTAAAFLADIGVTTTVFPQQNCPEPQSACRSLPVGAAPEQNPQALDALVFYLRALGVPARRNAEAPEVIRGEKLFVQAQCAVCHLPELRTGDYPPLPQIANQVIRPYTDLLLHDMGEGLADGRPEYRAGARDWRTPPLWGIGLSGKVNTHASLLHDGRARNVAEAILWHGGEAADAREAYRNMSNVDRDALTAFLASL